MNLYRERLDLALKHAGINQSQLARNASILLGKKVSAQTVQHLCDPKKNAIGSKYTNVFAEVTGVRAAWLERNEGHMLSEEEKNLNTERHSNNNNHLEIELLNQFRKIDSDYKKLDVIDYVKFKASDNKSTGSSAADKVQAKNA